jgi:hypothetical protein
MKPINTQDAAAKGDSDETTPGRPTDESSRQQTHKDQASQSGSPELDREATRRTGTSAVPTKPPGPK